MNFYDKNVYEDEVDKRIHALKREIKTLTKHRGKKMGQKLGHDMSDITSSLKDSGRHILNKLKGRSDMADFIDRKTMRHPGKLTALALGIGAILTAMKAIQHHRCNYH